MNMQDVQATMRKTERHHEFMQLIAEHGEALSKYCRFLTGTAPDAEDLLQETWLKAWAAFRIEGGTRNRTYFRNVAYHAWIDRLRKKRDESLNVEPEQTAVGEVSDPLRLWSAADRLVRVLTPDQRTIYLLMEHMRFTAAETAELLGTTEGGVKASLHRARTKLNKHRRQGSEQIEYEKENNEADEQTIFAYMQAIRLQDVRALMVLWNGGSGEEAALAVRCAVALRRGQPRSDPMQAPHAGNSVRSALRLQLAA